MFYPCNVIALTCVLKSKQNIPYVLTSSQVGNGSSDEVKDGVEDNTNDVAALLLQLKQETI